MKAVILAGGRGTRMGEETNTVPKPMILVGHKPILYHIMKHYSYYGINEFVICLGYKGEVIRDYFINYEAYNSDFTVDLSNNKYTLHGESKDNWVVTLANTGLDTQTGGRLKRVQKYLDNERFMLTYGDGISDINLKSLLSYHIDSISFDRKGIATLTTVLQRSRFGEISHTIDGQITSFEEKAKTTWINGGFFVFEPEVFDYIEGDDDPLEGGMLARLTFLEKLYAYKHEGFWQCLDTPKEVMELNKLWESGKAPWRI